MTAAEILVRAAELVEQSWGRGANIDYIVGPWCAGLAINRARRLLAGQDQGERAWAALSAELEIPPRLIPLWNDAPGRTKEEVATALRNAKRHLVPMDEFERMALSTDAA